MKYPDLLNMKQEPYNAFLSTPSLSQVLQKQLVGVPPLRNTDKV